MDAKPPLPLLGDMNGLKKYSDSRHYRQENLQLMKDGVRRDESIVAAAGYKQELFKFSSLSSFTFI